MILSRKSLIMIPEILHIAYLLQKDGGPKGPPSPLQIECMQYGEFSGKPKEEFSTKNHPADFNLNN